jgi:hypothetical protein
MIFPLLGIVIGFMILYLAIEYGITDWIVALVGLPILIIWGIFLFPGWIIRNVLHLR